MHGKFFSRIFFINKNYYLCYLIFFPLTIFSISIFHNDSPIFSKMNFLPRNMFVLNELRLFVNCYVVGHKNKFFYYAYEQEYVQFDFCYLLLMCKIKIPNIPTYQINSNLFSSKFVFLDGTTHVTLGSYYVVYMHIYMYIFFEHTHTYKAK